jgi:hypothetical protein
VNVNDIDNKSLSNTPEARQAGIPSKAAAVAFGATPIALKFEINKLFYCNLLRLSKFHRATRQDHFSAATHAASMLSFSTKMTLVSRFPKFVGSAGAGFQDSVLLPGEAAGCVFLHSPVENVERREQQRHGGRK